MAEKVGKKLVVHENDSDSDEDNNDKQQENKKIPFLAPPVTTKD